MFKTLIYEPLLTTLIFFTKILNGSFGFAIILLTLIIRTILLPLSLPAQKSAKKIRDLKPMLDELKKKHGKDKRRLQQEQLNLYKEHGVNPAAGCFPTIIQFAILIGLYRVFIDFINGGNGGAINANMQLFWLDLSQPDPLFILPVIAGLSQLILSQMLMTGKEHHQLKDLSKKVQKHELKELKKDKQADQESSQEMAESIQQQMLYVMPIMTGLIALRLPSGLAVYWVTTTIYSLVQQYFISGLGGLSSIFAKFKLNK